MLRLFVAIAIPEPTARVLVALCEGLPGVRWGPRENLHVTLYFAGEISETAAEDFDSELGAITLPSFEIGLSGVGVFDGPAGPRSLWAGVDANHALTRLRSRCVTAARRAGLRVDRRAWRPHITLAYVADAPEARIAAWIQANSLARPPAFRVETFGLYSSRRGAEAASYRLERAYGLAAPANS